MLGAIALVGVAVADEGTVEWTEMSPSRGVVVLVHGLNNSPGVMRELGALMRAHGMTTGIVTLPGHAGDMRPLPDGGVWVEAVRRALGAAAARYPGQPIIGLGFSLGATTLVAALENLQSPRPDKLILIAPAITLKGYTAAIRLIAGLGLLGLEVPSFVPAAYQASQTTPLSYYRHLFALVDRLLTRPPIATWREIPTLVVSAAEDEFVSYRRWNRYVREWGGVRWRHVVLPASRSGLPQHLLVDATSFGPENWSQFGEVVAEFLTGS